MADMRHPRHILHLTAGSDAGGVSRYLHDVCQASRSRGHQTIIAGEKGAWHWLFEKAPWPWIELPLKGNLWTLRQAGRSLTRRLAQTDRPPVDLVHCHYRKAALVGRRVSKKLGVPMLFTLHLTGIPMHGIWRWMSDFGDHTHAASSEAKQWLIDVARVPADQITVIPHGVDPAAYPLASPRDQAQARTELGLGQETLVAAYVGRLDDPKNVDWMLDLAQASRQRLAQLRVVIAGQGPHEERLRKRIHEDNLADRVSMLGHRNPLGVYQAADALLLPSGLEGFSLVCTEAMSVGRPVLRTRTAGASEQIVEGVTGRAVPVERSAFVETAIQFLSDETSLKNMGQAAARHVRTRLSFDMQVEQTLALYERLIGRYKAS